MKFGMGDYRSLLTSIAPCALPIPYALSNPCASTNTIGRPCSLRRYLQCQALPPALASCASLSSATWNATATCRTSRMRDKGIKGAASTQWCCPLRMCAHCRETSSTGCVQRVTICTVNRVGHSLAKKSVGANHLDAGYTLLFVWIGCSHAGRRLVSFA